MPTYAVTETFLRDFRALGDKQREAFRRAVGRFVDDLGGGRFRPGLRVKGIQGMPGCFEMTWAKDGRAVFTYGLKSVPASLTSSGSPSGPTKSFRSDPGVARKLWRSCLSTDTYRRGVAADPLDSKDDFVAVVEHVRAEIAATGEDKRPIPGEYISPLGARAMRSCVSFATAPIAERQPASVRKIPTSPTSSGLIAGR